jgi:hypothetical protein
MNNTTYILMWCNEGLESVINATEEDQNHLMGILADRPAPGKRLGEMLYYMTMRARFNTQRHYEIYAVDTDGSISPDDFWAMFEERPQETADLIRERGRLIHSDRAKSNLVKIV